MPTRYLWIAVTMATVVQFIQSLTQEKLYETICFVKLWQMTDDIIMLVYTFLNKDQDDET